MTALTLEDLEARRSTLGASDAAAVLGVSRWKKRIDVWAEKVGISELDPTDTPQQAYGRIMEPLLIRWTGETLPARIRRNSRSVRHPVHRFISATPDGLGLGSYRSVVVEAKTSRTRDGYGEEGSDEIPIDYKVQAVVQAEILDVPKVYVPVLFQGEGWPPTMYVVQPSAKERGAVIEALVEFWTEFVIPRVEPDELSDEYVRARWKHEEPGKELVATDELVAIIDRYRLAFQNVKAAEAAKEELATIIAHRMGDAEKLVHPYGSITWKTGKPRTDWRLVAKAFRGALEKIDEELAARRDVFPFVPTGSDLDALESLHTAAEGTRVFRPYWKEGDSE